MKHTMLAAAMMLAASGLPLQAQETLTTDPTLPTTRVGTRGATFLHLGVGARAQALAGAYGALADDVSALYWNTAGIGKLDGFSAAFSQANLYDGLGIEHTFVGVVLPVGLTRLGLSLNTLTSGEMPWQDPGFPNNEFGGDPNPLRPNFEWTGTAVGLHLSRPITDRLLFGGALKYVREGIQGAEATYIGGDLGTSFRTGLYGVTLGASLTNLGSSARMEGRLLESRVNTGGSETSIAQFIRIVELQSLATELELPTAFRFSVMADLIGDATAMLAPNPDQSLRLLVDLTEPTDADLQTAMGLEYGFREMAFLRAGKRWYNEAQISRGFSHGAAFGAGLRVPVGDIGRLQLDYAYTSLVDLEKVQVFSVEIHF